jgi:hypothetical protein
VKNVFPMLAATLVLGATAAKAEPFNCNDFPDFHARMSCYDAVSRGPARETAQQVQSPDASSKAASTHKVKKNKKRRG